VDGERLEWIVWNDDVNWARNMEQRVDNTLDI
jgi:hypothetical protein